MWKFEDWEPIDTGFSVRVPIVFHVYVYLCYNISGLKYLIHASDSLAYLHVQFLYVWNHKHMSRVRGGGMKVVNPHTHPSPTPPGRNKTLISCQKNVVFQG